MKLKEIFNHNNIKSFVEGYAKYFYDKLVGLPKHNQEEIAWRLSKCQEDCIPNKACVYCSCPPEKKVFVKESCNNGERFPDLRTKEEWEEFKKENNIT
jgi:hypothetical protein